MITVLITNLGAPASRGTLYMLKNNPDNTPIRAIGIDHQPTHAASWVDAFYEVSHADVSGHGEEVAAICRREEVDLILPQTDFEAIVLARTDLGSTKIATVDAHLIERAGDKAALMDYFDRLGLPCAKRAIIEDADGLRRAAHELGYPARDLVVKPRRLWGSRGCRILTTRQPDPEAFFLERPTDAQVALEPLCDILDRHPNPPELLVMELLPGKEYSVDAFIGAAGEVAIPRERTQILGGTAFETVLEQRPDIAAWTLEVGRALELRYAFGMQYKLDAEGIPKVLECNPRIQGTMVASFFGGPNIIWLSVCEALNLPATLPKAVPGPITFSRYWGGVATTPTQTLEI